MTERAKRIVAPLLLLVFLFGVWEIVVRVTHAPSFVLPPPSRIVVTFFAQFGFLWSHALVTLTEVALGLALGSVGGMLVATAIVYVPLIEWAVHPLIIASQMVPVFAIAPLLIIWLGYGLWPKVVVAALVCFFPVAINGVDGLRATSEETLDLFRSLGASRWQTFAKLRFPGSLPAFFSGWKVAATLSVVGATIGEWIGASRGLGFLMLESNARLRVHVVFAAILMLALVGLLLFGIVRIIEAFVLRWRRPASEGGR
jgi:ABC-type nitrate/sulfonate/bicarbonate transport system permease component